jgi:hypothetical protein
MLRALLIAYNPSAAAGGRQAVVNFINSRPETKNWYSILEGAILVITPNDHASFSELIRNAFPSMYFICTEVDLSTVEGFLPRANWDFIRDKHSVRQ